MDHKLAVAGPSPSIRYGVRWFFIHIPVGLLEEESKSVTSVHHQAPKANFEQAQSATLAPWFPPHLQRNVYLSLLHLEPEEGEKKSPAVPESVIRAALLRRAVEDIHRIVQVRSAKQACSTLLQRGSVGDDLWQRFERAEKEMEEELRDVVMEVSNNFILTLQASDNATQANALAPNWGQAIFQSANEIAANTIFRKRLEEIQAQTDSEKEWWEKRRASIQTEFMKELDKPIATS